MVNSHNKTMTGGVMASNKEKKAFLRRYMQCVQAEKSIEDEIEKLRSSVILPANVMDGMPHGTTKSDLSAYAARLDALFRKLQAELNRMWETRKTIIDAIEELDDETEKLVLKYRYINGWKWERIAETEFYSYQHVHKIHQKALEHLKIPEKL